MRVFNCGHCGHLVFFDSVQCLHCGSALAFVPEEMDMVALALVDVSSGSSGLQGLPEDNAAPLMNQSAATGPLWRRLGEYRNSNSVGQLYRMCRNHTQYQACNLAIPADQSTQLCASCRQTRTIPDLSNPANLRRWQKLEAAKRQLFYTLDRLNLIQPPQRPGPQFEFLADLPGSAPIMTGHFGGTITLNVAEADDDERARRRVALGEPYRTLIGHFRHESGHFYWDQLVCDGGQIEAFRRVFGDERQDYAAALNAHYAKGAFLGDWGSQHVSAYAMAHPWEDWAETWAHYLHLVDLLETAASYQVGVSVPTSQAATPYQVSDPFATPTPSFQDMVRQWVPLTLMLNSLNRSLGQDDAYPFALSAGAMVKLRFVHDLVQAHVPAVPVAPVFTAPGTPSDML
jgi:hypothetical protein